MFQSGHSRSPFHVLMDKGLGTYRGILYNCVTIVQETNAWCPYLVCSSQTQQEFPRPNCKQALHDHVKIHKHMLYEVKKKIFSFLRFSRLPLCVNNRCLAKIPKLSVIVFILVFIIFFINMYLVRSAAQQPSQSPVSVTPDASSPKSCLVSPRVSTPQTNSMASKPLPSAASLPAQIKVSARHAFSVTFIFIMMMIIIMMSWV